MFNHYFKEKKGILLCITINMDSIYLVISLVCVQSLKGRPPPAPLFGDDEEDNDLDWLN